MEYTYEEVLEAYTKLKTYIYYDSTNLILRVALAEFETGITESSSFLEKYFYYIKAGEKFDIKHEKGEQLYQYKLKVFTKALNEFHETPDFFNSLLSEIKTKVLPKKIIDTSKVDSSIISNVRTLKEYNTERVTIFIDASIELHIISVLWIMKSGYKLDSSLLSNCFGNRLILNKKRDGVVQGSTLFKPYARQYQKWRDNAILSAKTELDKGRNISILNLDIKDFFYSCRIPISEIEASDYTSGGSLFQSLNNLYDIFGKIHSFFTKLIVRLDTPYDFKNEIIDDDGNIKNVVLPIGLLSSFVLANEHLSDFDKSIINKVKPVYYGRYVDDIIMVIPDSVGKPKSQLLIEKKKSSTENYLQWIKNNEQLDSSEKYLSNPEKLNNLEKYIVNELHPVISLIDLPSFIPQNINSSSHDRVFKLTDYSRLYCQSEKTLMYKFDSNETSLVIDKLKRDLEEKSSEFRNYDDSEKEEDFEESAYHLLYDGTEGKLRTLKDYKEDRFGLAVYLSKRIFSSLRKTDSISDIDADKIVNFFKGINSLNLYTLWERVFTLFLVNNKPIHYVQFYLNCIDTITKLKSTNLKINHELLIQDTLCQLELANELALALNPTFLSTVKSVQKTYLYSFNDLKNHHEFFKWKYQPTSNESFYISRFRRSNLIRHHYCSQPLLTYTSEEKTKNSQFKDFTKLEISLDTSKYVLKESRLNHSPRTIKMWEITLATFFEELSSNKNYNKSDIDIIEKSFSSYLQTNSAHSNNFSELTLDDFIYHSNGGKKNSQVTQIEINNQNKLSSPLIAVVNTKVLESNIALSIQNTPNLSGNRFDTLYKLFKQSKEEKVDILLFPECFIPIDLLDRIVWFSAQEQTLVVTGLEHISINNVSYNFIVTILPFIKNGVKDAIVSFRLKNHYSYGEQTLIATNHCSIPVQNVNRYTLFNWRNIYFSPYYCFELADVHDRSLFKGKLDLLIASEFNRDVNYFSNIVESTARDLHTYVAQVNTSQYGDSRITQPAKTALMDILNLKGGENDTILVGKLDITELRNFQRNLYITTQNHPYLKPLPPNYLLQDVLVRIKNGRYIL